MANPTSTDHHPQGLDDQSTEHHSVEAMITRIPKILPHERVFPIQIGSELFKLSGASISSDAPSYFSQYFQCQIKEAEEKGEDLNIAIKTLYIDRDPVTFRDIALHLQGYHVRPRDSTHFVRLFADAQFYSLPKLISQLYEEPIFTTIGDREFQIPRELFSEHGNSPNFFSLGFAAFFSRPDDLFPGLDREGLLRPPSILPPSVPGRSAETFAEILHLLRGYPVEIRSEAHRAALLSDCRYFNFKALEQRLIPHEISYNLARHRNEIVLRLRDILKSGIGIAREPTPTDPAAAWVSYRRPYVDKDDYELVLEIGGESTRLVQFTYGSVQDAGINGTESASKFYPAASQKVLFARAEFVGETKARVAKLFEVLATKLGLNVTTQPLGLLMNQGGASSTPPTPGNTPISDDLVKVVIGPEAGVTLDGREWVIPFEEGEDEDEVEDDEVDTLFGGEGPRKRRKVEEGSGWPLALPSPMAGFVGETHGGWRGAQEWLVKTGQWRLRIQGVRNGKAPVECCLMAVKLDAFSSERERNVKRKFLGS